MVAWRPILGFEGRYSASDDGQIYSHLRSGQVLSTKPEQVGYPQATLIGADGSRNQRLVHNLVIEAFLGPRPPGLQVRHLDDVKANNCLSNLAFGTVSDNAYDKVANGHDVQTNKTHCPHGHEYAGDNLCASSNSQGRKCRTCKREWDRLYRLRNKK